MPKSMDLFDSLVKALTLDEKRSEKEAIVLRVMEDVLNLSQTEILRDKMIEADEKRLMELIERLNRHEPIQYLFGEADFYSRKYFVNRDVLIPRPETEILVREVVGKFKSARRGVTILDIGTGSGCIAITLALELPQVSILATDSSSEALYVAKENARRLDAQVSFYQHNILEKDLKFGPLFAVVSNPPYVPHKDKSTLARNVRDYEPATALYVPDGDPLLFYRVIGQKALASLLPGGSLFVEINEKFGNETVSLLTELSYQEVRLIEDLDKKPRIVTAIKPH